MPQLSENQFSEFTGKDRKTIKRLLDGLQFTEGPHKARLYESKDGFERIYLGVPGEDGATVTSFEAVRLLNIKRAEEIALDMEIKRKQRIPLEIVTQADDETYQSIAAILKSRKGKRLDEPVINEIFDLLREIPAQRKW